MRINWRWRHGPLSGPAHAALALTAAQTVGTLPVVDARPEYVLGAGAAAMGVTVLRGRTGGRSRIGVTYRLAGLGGSSVWLAQAISEGGWTPTLAWTLAAGAVTAGAAWRPVMMWDRHAAAIAEERALAAVERVLDEDEQNRLHSVADQWVARLARVCAVKGARVAGIEDWVWPGPDGQPRVTGYTLEVVLPDGGTTWRTIAQYSDGLASSADLPEGCGIEVGPGIRKRRCLIEVSTVDALRDDMPYIPATAPGSIDQIPFGTHRNGSPAVMPMRFESTLLTGAKRSGKTNELLAILGRVLECDNTLVCVIDYNGGAVALPWLAPWVDQTIDRPPILWVADTPEEAELMCSWLVAVIEFRKKHYHAANTARDDDKIDASPDVPQLLLVTDEFGALDKRVKDQIWQINDRGGGAAVTTLTCSLGSTATYVPTELLAQLSNRIAMRVNQENALGYLFEWQGGKGRAKPEDAPHTGYGHYRVAAGEPKVFKGPRIVPSVVRQVAVTTAAWRPELDEATARMTPEWAEVFARRWDRARHLLEAAAGRPVGAAAGSGGGGGSRPPSPPPDDGASGTPAERLRGAMDDMFAAAEQMRNAEPSSPAPRDDAAEFERIVAGVPIVPELLVRILDAFGQQERMHTRVLAERIGARAETLGGLLSQVDVRPLKSDFTVDGRRARGYARADVEAAADRIRMGELPVPDDVCRWRPPGG